MINPYRNKKELCEWLKANSSGAYRPSAHAASIIEEQESELTTLRAELDNIKTSWALLHTENEHLREVVAAIDIPPHDPKFPELDKDHLIKICIKQNLELEQLRAYKAECAANGVLYIHPGDKYWLEQGGKVHVCKNKSDHFSAPLCSIPSDRVAEPVVSAPEFLLEMSKQMREQPNRMTAHPFWQVRCKRCLATEQGVNQIGFEIISDDGVVYRSYASEEDELELLLLGDYPEFCQKWCEELDNGDSVEDAIGSFDPTSDDLPEGLRLVYVQETEEVVSTHLTEADAKWFIRRKQHDYPKLYTYVESAYWSPQLRRLQDWIISLSAPSP